MMILKLAAAAVVLAMLVHLGVRALQQALIYFPDSRRIAPAAVGLEAVEEREFSGAGGDPILVWHARAKPGLPTILYFHGNAGSFANRAERIRKQQNRGIGVVMATYRGYGGRPGRPSERANVDDAKAVLAALVADGVPVSSIILYGESLGSGVAVQVAVGQPVAGIILDAPYTSLVDLAAYHYPYLPARWLMTDRYETVRHLPGVISPVLVLHGEQDEVIPVAMGRAVAAQVPTEVEMVTCPNAGHSDHHHYGSDQTVYAWIDRIWARAKLAPSQNGSPEPS
jgi:pimeloyl-ACP methyl ester carboxylesterase